jgi:hypothetical protein
MERHSTSVHAWVGNTMKTYFVYGATWISNDNGWMARQH